MRFPWPKRETRSQSFTEARLTAISAGVSGSAIESAAAVVEVAAGLWARGFASATITPDNPATRSLTAPVLARIGRSLLSRGQAVFEIAVTGGRLRLVPASTWDVTGGADPATWTWDVDIPGPSGTVTRSLSSDRILNLTYSEDSARPWVGLGPLQLSKTTVDLMSNIETRLRQEMGQAVGNVIPLPNVNSATQLQADLRALNGELSLVESTSGGWGEGSQGAPESDWQPRRLGGNPPQSVDVIRSHVAQSILAAAGVPISLIAGGDGALAREGWRQFMLGTLAPVSRIIIPALAEGLDSPDLAFDFSGIGASDIAGRARAFQSLVGGGMGLTQAAGLSGLVINDDG